MKDKREQTGRAESADRELFADPDEVVSFAQAFYATEFPNTERRGCPSAAAVREAANSGTLPGPELREHLFGCSECFLAYRGARLNRAAQAAAPESWRDRIGGVVARLILRPSPAAAGLACLVFIAGALAVLAWRASKVPGAVDELAAVRPSAEMPVSEMPAPHARDSEAPAGLGSEAPAAPVPQTPDAGVPESATVEAQREAATARPAARPRRSRRAHDAGQAPSPRLVEISLNDASLLRGAGEAAKARRTITLPAERQLLRLRLPAGSRGGRYTVAVVDAFGKVLTSASSRSDGRTLTVELDLTSWPEKRCRLSVSRAGEAPDFYVLDIAGKPATR
ncbi:MAG TPA: hypothetical protein VEY09_11885 [Pyrinomonadaceae bacterium]|nr:hypothetical protein [Pyrinomonadaceae bacterium]